MEKLRQTLKVKKERAVLVAAIVRGVQNGDDLAELTALADSAGANVVDRLQQKTNRINPSMYIGKGKARELADRVRKFKGDVVIFDNDLSPGQIRELEKVLKVKVLDRSELILDIFATRAKTRQAKLQVELAQLEYTYPRLTRMWTHLERLAGAGGGGAIGAVGGIGTRGPGEKQLEIDRRLVNKRITDLKRELAHIDKRKIREITGRKGKFKVCLVGYTNAGKSTLLNKLTDSSVFVEDRLFATLDTRTRKWVLERGVDVLLSDTVGFIRNLPHQLVASFKATLEEAVNADLLLHIADVSNPEVLNQIESVKQVLKEIGCGDKSALLVLNKVDIVKQMGMFEMVQTLYPDALCISAKRNLGQEQLKERVLMEYRGGEVFLRIVSRQSNGKVQHFIRACGTIIKETYIDGTVQIEARLGSNQLAELKSLHPVSVQIMQS
ncbi:MAG: GTPase HflX [Planctomycetota bacterium]